MKRVILLIVLISLLSSFAIAGQVSDYFRYFTGDAFSLITGAQVTNLENPNLEKPVATTSPKKANGAVCNNNNECKSNACSRETAIGKGICGKRPSQVCVKNEECYSGKCSEKKCARSTVGKPCLKETECAANLQCGSKKCVPKKEAKTTTSVKETGDEVSALETKVNSKIDDLTSKVNKLLALHKSPVATKEVKNTGGNLIGKFLLQIQVISDRAALIALAQNGASCQKDGDCVSKVCYKLKATDKTGLCGRKEGRPCVQNANCLSGRCISNKCAKSLVGKPCLANSDCTNNKCDPKTKKCTAVAIAVDSKRQPLIRGEQADSGSESTGLLSGTQVSQEEESEQPLISVRTPARNGVSCNKDGDCISKVCYKLNADDASGLCGRKEGRPCVENANCLSNRCVSNKCAKSVIGGGCLADSDCINNQCDEKTKKCTAVAVAVGSKTPPLIRGEQVREEEKPPQALIRGTIPKKVDGAACRKSDECKSNLCFCSVGLCQAIAKAVDSDATPKIAGLQTLQVADTGEKSESVVQIATPKAKAVNESCSRNEECESKSCLCNPGKGRCRKFTVFATIAQPTAKPAATTVVSQQVSTETSEEKTVTTTTNTFNVITAQSILNVIYEKMNALKLKICLEAAKHTGIDYGEIKCKIDKTTV